MNKKAIAILGAIFILIVGTLGFLIYTKYGSKSSSTNTDQTGNNTNITTPITDNNTGIEIASTTPIGNLGSKFVKLGSDLVISPVLFYNGNGVTYFDNQGQLFQSDLQDSNGQLEMNNKRQLENIPVKANISKILWPSRGNDFIAEFNSMGKKSWSHYSSITGAFTDYPSQIVSVDWMPSGDKIMYVWLENGKATLNIADPDTKNWKEVVDMWELDNEIHISPDGLSILYFETANSSASNSINLTTTDGKLWRGLIKEGYNYGVLWSPDSQKFLFNKKEKNSQKYQLWYYDILTGESKNLGLFTTIEKAVWGRDSQNIYAAVPKAESSAAESGNLTSDDFYKFNTSTMEKKAYIADQQIMDGRVLFLNLSGDKLFFKNAQDGSLYYLDLNQ